MQTAIFAAENFNKLAKRLFEEEQMYDDLTLELSTIKA